MFYTIMPLEVVFEGIETMPTRTIEQRSGGLIMQVEPLDDFQVRVVRLISSDPRDYLSPRYQPGAIIRRPLV